MWANFDSGINWGADLSFRWIYVSSVDPSGEAAETMIEKGLTYIIYTVVPNKGE